MTIRLFLLLACCFFSFDQPKLVKKKVTSNITVSLPKEWRPMDTMDFAERYPSVRAPLAAYTDYERTRDFSVNVSATQWPDANLEIAQRFFKSSVTNMFDRVEMISEGIHEVNGKKYIYFEIQSRVNGNRMQEGQRDPILRYTYLQYLVEPGRTLVFSFNCPQRERETWQPIAQAIMESIVIK